MPFNTNIQNRKIVLSKKGQLREDFTGTFINGWAIGDYVGSQKYECTCENGHTVLRHVGQIKERRLTCCRQCKANQLIKEIVGKKFGKWEALEYIIPSNENRRSFLFKCVCECGKVRILCSRVLLSNHTNSCHNCSGRLPVEVAGFNVVYCRYKAAARNRKVKWELSKDEFRGLVESNCYYTGLPPSTICKVSEGSYIYNGVDRLDSSKGYFMDNCVPCITRVNIMKMNLPYSEFIELCALITKTISEKNNNIQLINNLKAV